MVTLQTLSMSRDGIIKLSSESENKETVIVLNDNATGAPEENENKRRYSY